MFGNLPEEQLKDVVNFAFEVILKECNSIKEKRSRVKMFLHYNL